MPSKKDKAGKNQIDAEVIEHGETGLVHYDAFKRELAVCATVDEVMDIKDRARALEVYARQIKDTAAHRQLAMIRIRAERRCGEILKEMAESGERDIGRGGDRKSQSSDTTVKTLADLGISKDESSKYQELASVPEEEFEEILNSTDEFPSTQGVLDRTHNFRAVGSGDNEWYTPTLYIAAARKVLGEIELDAASSEQAQTIVNAQRYFTKTDDALVQEWRGKTWLNPPFSRDLIGQFIDKLLNEIAGRNVTEAILLTHNYTDTRWFCAAEKKAALICFTDHRIKFLDAEGNECAPTQGQAFFYYGENTAGFKEHFHQIGWIR